MREWGRKSRAVRSTLDPRLQQVTDYVLHNVADVSLLAGHRGRTEQNYYFSIGRSKVRWPFGKHNKVPSLAVDYQPYPLPQDRIKRWAALAYIAGRAIEYAKQELDLTLRWGGDWNQNGDLTDQNFDDLFHLEIQE